MLVVVVDQLLMEAQQIPVQELVVREAVVMALLP
jgi:hypothetical protein